MTRLGKILVLAAVAMLAMGVGANGVMAGAGSPGKEPCSLTVQLNPVEGFFDKRYAKPTDFPSMTNHDYGRISVVVVNFFHGKKKIQTASLAPGHPSYTFSSDKEYPDKVQISVKLIGVSQPVVKEFDVSKTKQAIVDVFAVPNDKYPDIYQIQAQKE